MSTSMHCQLCGREIDLAQRFTYLVEVETQTDPTMMAAIRRLPHRGGVPLRVCRGCQVGIERTRIVARDLRPVRRNSGQALLMAALTIGIGVMAVRLGTWL